MDWSGFRNSLKNFFFREKAAPDRQKAMAAFKRRYLAFKDLLQSNADLALIFARLNQAQAGEISVDVREVRKLSRRAILLCGRMAKALNSISANRHGELSAVCKNIGARIEHELRRHTRGDLRTIALPLSEIDASMDYIVGGKSANLGEIRNILGMPVPDGFALTIKAGTIMLMRNGDLMYRIYDHLNKVDIDKPHTIKSCARNIARLIESYPVPDSLMEPALEAWDKVFGDKSHKTIAAVRSSAVAEDGVQSFAGQYDSVLGVTRENLGDSIRKVIASLYSEKALAYRAAHGYALDATGMGICCVEMVPVKAAGVAFSRHPVDLRSACVLINSSWGLGETVVDGTGAADQWEVSRAAGKIRQSSIASKDSMRKCDPEIGVIVNEAVPESMVNAPSLADAQIKKLAEMSLALENHYHYPQDMEWAINDKDEIIVLQTRPLGMDCSSPDYNGEDCLLPEAAPEPPILSGGDIAAKGIACGVIVPVHANEDLGHFPEGSILLAKNSSPNIMPVLRRAGGVIAETGSLTGHMASLCREFGIPALLNLPNATKILKKGEIVTLDALTGRVFKGEIAPLLELKINSPVKQAANTPGLAMLRRVAPYILPLHLIDPRSDLFTPDNCTSLHDIMRYAHEKSYTEMFQISDRLSESGVSGTASKLVCRIPLDLYVIDLGGGLKTDGLPRITPRDILSIPFSTLLSGMLDPKVQNRSPRPINMKGFLSVMGQSMSGGNLLAGERFGERSYAIVSDRYLNFSSRIGYHYAILDTWCGETINKNYIRFEFAGGAAGDEQRARRARCIGLILGELGFSVDVNHDRIQARFQKYPQPEISDRLIQLGRLLIMTRQMDMLMVNEEAVTALAHRFLEGDYF